MIFQGSKNRISKYIVPVIQQYIDDFHVENYCEPFVGGANIIDKISCKNRLGSDTNKYLIALLEYVREHPQLDFAPAECTFEHYSDVRKSYRNNDGRYSLAYIGLIGFSASYGGRFFDGGYGRDKTGKRNIYAERLAVLRAQSSALAGIKFFHTDYLSYDPSKYHDWLFYCDPPYKGTKSYGGSGGGWTDDDYVKYYNWCSRLAENNIVIMSEYDMPADKYKCIWSKDINVYQKSDRLTADKAVEKLFIANYGGTNNES